MKQFDLNNSAEVSQLSTVAGGAINPDAAAAAIAKLTAAAGKSQSTTSGGVSLATLIRGRFFASWANPRTR